MFSCYNYTWDLNIAIITINSIFCFFTVLFTFKVAVANPGFYSTGKITPIDFQSSNFIINK